MAAVTARNPVNKDLLQSTKFRLNFDMIKDTTYYCQSVNLPGVSLSEVPRATPFIDLYVPGEKLVYDVLSISFLVDEDLVSWLRIHDWIRAMTFPVEFQEYANLKRMNSYAANKAANGGGPQYSDAIVTVYTNKNNPNIRIKFKDLFPTSLDSVQFNATDSAENIITATATFRFSYYNIEMT
jgi:hypothetical protein